MRYLILDAKYPGYLDQIYRDDPELSQAPYEEQIARIQDGLFGEVSFQVKALRSLGHDADSIVVNATDAQRAWARENGVKFIARSRWMKRRWHRVPIIRPVPEEVAWPVVYEQVRRATPDVTYIGIVDTIPPDVVAAIRPFTRLIVGQIAAATPNWDFRGYDLMLSGIPDLVRRFRSQGLQAELMPLAFDSDVALEIGRPERDVPISFVGSFTAAYDTRLEVCEAVARVVQLQTWTPDPSAVPAGSPIKESLRGSAFGRDLYAVMARSCITLNTHGRIAGLDANNLRLFEATGMGAMLLTDDRRNLGELFEVGREVVAFSSPSEAAEMASYYIDHPDEAAVIAAAGQARTNRDHTWTVRMQQTNELIDSSLRKRLV